MSCVAEPNAASSANAISGAGTPPRTLGPRLRQVLRRPADQFDAASRISFGLWDSLPDEQLTSAAKTGKLATHDEIAGQLQRMLPDLRTRSKLREFFLAWLKISQPRDLSKDPKAFPEFTPDVISDLRTSIELSLDEIAENRSEPRRTRPRQYRSGYPGFQ